jgi:hypothetical protein
MLSPGLGICPEVAEDFSTPDFIFIFMQTPSMTQKTIRSLSICFTIIIIAVSSCSKDRQSPTPPSSEKKLNSVIFKASDNPGLLEDFICTITSDSIKVKLPGTISLNGLVPTIDFIGASISPANRAPQNFSNPVTYTITAQDGSTSRFGSSISYRTHSDTLTMIIGKWGVITDTVTNSNFNYPGGAYPIPGTYTGVPSDYWDFHTNDTVYIAENNNTGSSPYQVLPNGRISMIIASFNNYNYECAIQQLSSTRMTLSWYLTSNIGGVVGIYTRKCHLKK